MSFLEHVLFLRVGLTHPILRHMRQQWRSTGNTRLPREYIMTQRAVFKPTPGREVKKRWQSPSVMRFNGARVGRPNSSQTAFISFLIARAFWTDNPPSTIEFEICLSLATANEMKVGNSALRLAKVIR